ncbi:MAG: ABC transporter permease [Deltaproteobacteria bacterium]|nr:ABC transporter permease [Deltaproteobacteria bacterium]
MIPISYNLRSIANRQATTAATVIGIALVVFVLASTLMLGAGVRDTIGRSGSRDVAIVLRKGSDNELSSGIDQAKVGIILSSPGVKKGADGQPLGVGEVAMIISLVPKAAPEGMSNVQVRGVDADITRFRPDVEIVDGRMFAPGADEAIVGKSIAGRFVNLEVGGVIEPKKNRPLKIVGAFDDGGSALESEVWADVDFVRSAFGREAMVSSVRAKLESPSAFDAFEATVEGDKSLGLEAMTEAEWNEKQSQGLALFITVLGAVISFFFAIGASIGAMITMYGSVANRGREIGTLRAIGFPRRSILLSFVIEALLISLLGGVIGCIAALGMGFVKFSMLNFATFSEMVFRFHPTPTVFAISLGFALVMGLVGGILPAIRAARMSPVQAMRS